MIIQPSYLKAIDLSPRELNVEMKLFKNLDYSITKVLGTENEDDR